MVKNRIGYLRREQGLNQRELGDKLGVGQTTISAWETGKNEPDYKSIRAMTDLFEVSADYLLGFNDDHIRRGLSPAEYAAKQTRLSQQREEEQHERNIERYLREEKQCGPGLTEEEIEELEEDAAWDDWQGSGLPVQLETYKVIQLMENASKAQRAAALEHVQIVVKHSIV